MSCRVAGMPVKDCKLHANPTEPRTLTQIMQRKNGGETGNSGDFVILWGSPQHKETQSP